ncbi:hypothetical protein C0J52_17380 [Blattella germanica]|nr:hypothetical protein C0J52_17380 [Blattella germanica]
MIETNSKEEVEKLSLVINEKCSQLVEAKIPKLWDPSLVVYNIPEEITLDNAEENFILLNRMCNVKTGDLKPKARTTRVQNTLKLSRKLNPVEMKVGINSLKSLRNGQLLKESNKKEEADIICTNINEKCGGELEAMVSKKINQEL